MLVIGGGMANTFLPAQGKAVGKSLCEKDLPTPPAHPRRGRRPGAGSCCRSMPSSPPSSRRTRRTRRSPSTPSAGGMILDAGPASVAIDAAIDEAATLVWNGPFGAFELDAVRRGHRRGGPAAADRTQNGQAGLGRRRRRHGRRTEPRRRVARRSPTSRRPAARSSNGWRARRFRASRRCAHR